MRDYSRPNPLCQSPYRLARPSSPLSRARPLVQISTRRGYYQLCGRERMGPGGVCAPQRGDPG